MGITVNTIEQLVLAKQNGVDFTSTATIGHQAFWHCYAEGYRKIIEKYDLKATLLNQQDLSFLENGKYTDNFFQNLGSKNLSIFDANHYENATDIHDFNNEIPEKYHNKYSLVYDGGSLEHIFNAPLAIKNFMNMVKIGGHYVSAVPCNCWPGHGFYQFSPEFFYRALSVENGFTNTRVYLYHELNEMDNKIYIDPKILGHRVEFSSTRQLSLFVISEKINNTPIFSQYPQQSDYQFANWLNK